MTDDVISSKITASVADATGIDVSLPEDIGEVLECVPAITKESLPALTKEFRDTTQSNLERDYDFAVGNLREMIVKGMKAVDGAVALARESESPRMFEAASTFLKTLSDLNKDLVGLSEEQVKKQPKANAEQASASGTVTNNSIFIGSSEDLASIVQARIKQSLGT